MYVRIELHVPSSIVVVANVESASGRARRMRREVMAGALRTQDARRM